MVYFVPISPYPIRVVLIYHEERCDLDFELFGSRNACMCNVIVVGTVKVFPKNLKPGNLPHNTRQ